MVVSTDARVAGGSPAVGSRLGSFELTQPAGSWGGQARFQARGAADTAHAGVEALAIVCSLAGADRPRIDATVARVKSVAALRHERLAPVLEHGAWQGGVYLIQVLPGTETLAGRLGRQGALPPSDALATLERLAAGLDAAAAAGVPHGDVRLANIWLQEDGSPLLGGFLISPTAAPSAAGDAVNLAAVVASLLSGSQVPPPANGAQAAWDPPFGLPEVLRTAIARGIDPDASKRYPSAGIMAAAVREAVNAAVADQVAGAWVAIEHRDYAMAQMLCEAALRLRPNDPNIAALLHHTSAHAIGGNGSSASPLDFSSFTLGKDEPAAVSVSPAGPVPPTGSAPSEPAMPRWPSALAGDGPDLSGLPPELAALFTPPAIETKPAGTNSWAMLIMGIIIMVVMGVVAVLIALTYG